MLKQTKKTIKSFLPKSIWSAIREIKIIKQHQKVADFWNPIIDSYCNGNIEKFQLQPKQNFSHQKIIWQYWGQGIENNSLPEIIQICFDSVNKYKGEYTIIRLSDETISDYINLPQFVWDKKNSNPKFTRTFFSDLLRLALLNVYGGVWLDATILLTGKLPEKYESSDYFMFQRSDDEKDKKYWENVYAYYFSWHPHFKVRVLNSIIFAKKESRPIGDLLQLLLFFWKTNEHIPNYFFFQILYNELINGKHIDLKCPVVNDCIPHLLQTTINGSYDKYSFENILKLTNIHKMAYYETTGLNKLKSLLRNK